ncbi:MAG: hypothetical protein V4471_06945 [Pseudomonadota bacterium]
MPTKFLETQQALLAQIALPLAFAKLSLKDFYQQVQSREDLLSQAAYREKIQRIIQPIHAFIDNDPPEHQNTLLTTILERLSALLQEKAEKNNKETHFSSDSLPHSFRHDLLTALRDYIQHYHRQGQTIPEERYPDFNHLWNLIMSSTDILELREGFMQCYRAMQPVFFKLIPVLDFSLLRRRLKAVLENPKYSIEQLKFAAPPQVDKTTCQETNAAPRLSKASQSLQNSSEEIEQLEKRIQQLITNECSSSFFSKYEASNNDANLFKLFRSTA